MKGALTRHADSIVHRRLNELAVELGLPPVLMFVYPRPWDGGAQVALYCQHPIEKDKDMCISYHFGERHSWLIGMRGGKWADMRVETILRLLLKRLARCVANQAGEEQ